MEEGVPLVLQTLTPVRGKEVCDSNCFWPEKEPTPGIFQSIIQAPPAASASCHLITPIFDYFKILELLSRIDPH